MEIGLALAVVPILVGLVALAVRLGCPAAIETPGAIALGVVISLGYTLAATLPGGIAVADGLVNASAIGEPR
jgi:hypothetical protein